jgi:23S rRNA pseudouridine2605 synthase
VATERLQKILSNAGVASRRSAEQMILAGRISVNGAVVSTLGARADVDVDTILVDDIPVSRSRYAYVVLNKPRGVLSAASDDRGRVVVTDLVVEVTEKVHPVGRLDLESEGLVLLTNDGHLTNLLTHPKHEVEKEYLVRVDAALAERDLIRVTRGIESEGETLKAASARVVSPPGLTAEHWLAITLREGKKREIRRMLAALGRRVVTLRRVRLGTLALGDLKPGQSRQLTESEVASLYRLATGSRP